MSEAAIQTGQNAAAGGGAAQAAAGAAGQNAATGAPGSSTPAAAAGGASDASGGANWFDPLGLEPALRQHLHTRGYKGIPDLIKGDIEARALVGRKGVPVPGDQATIKERAEALRQFGAPEAPDKYEIVVPEGVPLGDADKAMQAAVRAKAHELGVPGWVMKELSGVMAEHTKAVYGKITEAQAAETKAGEAAIGEWEAGIRKGGGDPTKAKAIAQQAWQTILPPDSPIAAKLESALADPTKAGSGAAALVDLFHRVGTMISESGGVLKPAAAKGFGPVSQQAAHAELNAIYAAALADKAHPYTNDKHPEHAAMTQKVLELTKLAFPGMQDDG